MIAVIKNIRMFVVLNTTKRRESPSISCGYFLYLFDYILRFRTPVWNVNASTASSVLSNGTGGTVFYYYFCQLRINFSKMLKTEEKICSGVKYSTLVSTDDARQAFQERFPLVGKLKVKHRKYYYFAHAVYGERKLFCHAYKSWEALLARFTVEYADKVLAIDAPGE